jgi:hypothetical protein
MNSVTLLLQCAGETYDGLSVEDRKLYLLMREVDPLVTKIALATGYPSEIRVKRGQ